MSRLVDSEIYGRIRSGLDNEARLTAANLIHFTVENGVVDLYGEVGSNAEKAAAEAIARTQPGTRDVINSLTVAMAVPGQDNNRSIAAAVSEALARKLGERAKDIGVAGVQQGIVRLAGRAYAVAEERLAIEAAASVPGVRDVVSEVTVGEVSPGEAIGVIDDATLKGMVNSAITQRGITIFQEDTVVNRGVVRLRGRITNQRDAKLAEEAAAAVRGVQDVVSELVLDHAVSSTDPDEALAARVTDALHRDGRVSPADVHAEAVGGTITLFGQVESIDDQNAAAEVARTVPGVNNVLNSILITTRSSFPSSEKSQGQTREQGK